MLLQVSPIGVLDLSPGAGRMFGLNDNDEVLVSWLMPWIGISPQISFRQGMKKVQIRIFINTNDFPAYLQGAVWVVWVNHGKRDARITLEILKLLAVLGLAETDVIPIPVKPDGGALWLTLWPWLHAPGLSHAADHPSPVEYVLSTPVSFHHQSRYAVEPTKVNVIAEGGSSSG